MNEKQKAEMLAKLMAKGIAKDLAEIEVEKAAAEIEAKKLIEEELKRAEEAKKAAEIEKAKVAEEVKAQVKAGIDEILKSVPVESKMKMGLFNIIPGSDKRFSFANFLKAVKNNDRETLKKYHTENQKVIVEGTTTSGGYLTIPEYETEILRVVEDEAVVAPLCKQVPMRSDTKYQTIITSGITAYFVGENSEKTLSDWTLAQIELAAKKICCLTSVSNEELDDSTPATDSLLLKEFAISIANKVDYSILYGAGSGATDPWTGVRNLTNAVTESYSNAFDWDKIFTLIGQIKGNRAKTISIIYPPVIEGLMRKAKGNDGQYLWSDAQAATPSTFGGYRCYPDLNIPTNLGDAENETFIVVADFQNALLGNRSGIVFASGLNDTDFQYDRTTFRAVMRKAFTVPSAFETRFGIYNGIKIPS